MKSSFIVEGDEAGHRIINVAPEQVCNPNLLYIKLCIVWMAALHNESSTLDVSFFITLDHPHKSLWAKVCIFIVIVNANTNANTNANSTKHANSHWSTVGSGHRETIVPMTIQSSLVHF